MSRIPHIPAPKRGAESLQRPARGLVVAVHNSPGSPYAIDTPMNYDVMVDYGPPQNQIIYRNQPPANRYPAEYDVYGAGPGTTCLISWEGNIPRFTIDWSEAVTTDCAGGLEP